MTAPAVPFLPRADLARGVYRSTKIVPGMVTYLAISSMGDVVDDEYRSVRPGTVSEALAVARVQALLDERDPAIPERARLTLVTDASRAPASWQPPF